MSKLVPRILIPGVILAFGTVGIASTSQGRALATTVFAIVSCASSSPCTGGSNTSTGPGVQGTSTGGKGVLGQTTFKSTNPQNAQAGVQGQDLSNTASSIYNSGVNGTSVYGYGVTGSSTNNRGIFGTSTNNSGVAGLSTAGSGVFGSTGANARAGVYGSGTGTGSAYGVKGTTTGNGAAFFGSSTNGDGIDVTTTNGIGVSITDTNNTGVYSTNTNGYAIYGQTSAGASIYGVNFAGGAAGYFSSSSGYGAEAFSSSGPGFKAESFGTGIGINAISSTGDALHASTGGGVGALITNSNGNGADVRGTYIGLVGRAPSTGFPLVATDPSGNNLFYVDGSGAVFAHNGFHAFAPIRGGGSATAFGPRAATPTMEDTGTAQLVGGQAYVAFDSTFAQTIDRSRLYQVMLTPGGDTRGLYVASKTPYGFTVRETMGGRGSISFDYHIYATALGSGGERMAPVGPNARVVARPVERTKLLSPPHRRKPAF